MYSVLIGFIALFDKSDQHHLGVKNKLEEFRRDVQGKLITTWPIINEATYLLKEHVHLKAQLDFLNWIILGGLELMDLQKEDLVQIENVQRKYADLPMDFSDATLLVVAERLNVHEVFTIDKDFLIYRILGKKHFKNLMS